MKQILMIGLENAERAEELYSYLLNNYPRKTWNFVVRTINDIPNYKFTLSGKTEEVYKKYRVIFQ